MQEDIANLVHPVLSQGLALRDRLEAGAALNFDVEQAALKGMLLTELEAKRWVDFGGDVSREPARQGGDDSATLEFLGIRYVLACWLDEMFILFSSWEKAWTERKLEVALYGTNDRAWRFWQQASLAEKRPSTDALEACYLCVMLGFRGEMVETPEKLNNWIAAVRARLGKEHVAWQGPPELEPPTYVPPLRARDRLQRMVLACGMTLLVLIPIVVFVVVRHLGQ